MRAFSLRNNRFEAPEAASAQRLSRWSAGLGDGRRSRPFRHWRKAAGGGNNQPVLLNADELTYDETLGIVIASGDVELAQGDRLLLADRVTYNEKTSVVTATGNIRLLEPSGDVIFADYSELTNDLAQGFVQQVRVLLTDNSRVAGTEAERTDQGRYMRINRAVYSPCNLCESDPTRAPLWQLRANRVVHDKEEKEIVYRDARLEMFGIPVLYTPYFAHPDPSVDRKSGFLSPVFGYGGNLGTFGAVPYYWTIAPDKDLTLTPLFSTEDGVQMRAEWRQRFESGRLSCLTAASSTPTARRRPAPSRRTSGAGICSATGCSI